MRIDNDKYCWIDTGRAKAKLGYFLNFVYKNPRPLSLIETYFDVKKISSAISQAEYPTKRNDAVQWRNKMDQDFGFKQTINDRKNA